MALRYDGFWITRSPLFVPKGSQPLDGRAASLSERNHRSNGPDKAHPEGMRARCAVESLLLIASGSAGRITAIEPGTNERLCSAA